jgi:hypothetical protein
LTPTSFRGGRFSSGGVIHEFLRERGFLADTSIVPYTSFEDDGAPDYRDRDHQPVRLPPRHEGEQPLWLIPLTLGFTRRPFALWHRCYETVRGSWLRKLRLIGVWERLGLVRRAFLNFEFCRGPEFLALIRQLRRMQFPYICMMVHSSTLVAGKGVYTRTRADEDNLFAFMEEVFRTLAGWPDLRPATVTEVAQHLEEQHHASTRN